MHEHGIHLCHIFVKCGNSGDDGDDGDDGDGDRILREK